ncbi:MAG TPA: hypothetical protein VGE24_13060 [Emticicia sp.]
MIGFGIYVADDKFVHFSSWAVDPKFDLLTYTFGSVLTGKNLENWYNDFLKIYEGKTIMDESWGVRSWAPSGNIWITKKLVTYELEEDGKRLYLEIPAYKYKKLLEDWIKFVEINSKEFSRS